MFDVGFWELVMVGVISLVVFGPERLPRVAREIALWVRKIRSMAASVKAEIDHELELQELRESLLEEKRKIDRGIKDKPVKQLSVESSNSSVVTDPDHEQK